MHFMLMKNIELRYLRCLEVIAVMHGAAPAEARYKVSGVGEAVAAESASCSSSDAILHIFFHDEFIICSSVGHAHFYSCN